MDLWVCLECIGVVIGCCCKEVYRYPHNNYYFFLYTPLVYINSFGGSSIPILLCSFLKCFLFLFIYTVRIYCSFSIIIVFFDDIIYIPVYLNGALYYDVISINISAIYILDGG